MLDLNEGVLFVSLRVPDVYQRSAVLLAVDQTASGAILCLPKRWQGPF